MKNTRNDDYVESSETEMPVEDQDGLLRRVQELQMENERLKQRLEEVPKRDRLLRFLRRPPERSVRDPIYESIPLPREVSAIIDTPEFLRLRRIKQLTFVYLAWPGAIHNRFEHSLGVYYLTRQALISLLESDDTGVMESMTEEDINTVLAAALLHDIGHYPFSHAIEELGDPPIKHHELVGEEVILDSAITPVLTDVWEVEPRRVANLTTGKKVGGIDRLLHCLLSGTLDTDKMDYLVRDSRRCNVVYGLVDVAKLLESLKIRNEPRVGPTLVISRKGVGCLHSLIHAKRSMFGIVYGHHVNNIATAMLLRCVQDLLDEGLLNAQELTMQDDATLMELVKERSARGCPSSYDLVKRIEDRRLYKRGIIVTKQMTRGLFRELDSLYEHPAQRKKVEEALAQELSSLMGKEIGSHDVLLHIPRPIPYEVDIQVYYGSKARPLGYREFMDWYEATGLHADDLERYQGYVRKSLVIGTPEVCEVLRTSQGQDAAVKLLRRAGRL